MPDYDDWSTARLPNCGFPRHLPIIGQRQEVTPHRFEFTGADAVDALEIVKRAIVARSAPFLDDALGERWADARELSQLRPLGIVDIDQKLVVERPGIVDLHQLATQSPRADVPDDHAHQRDGCERRNDGLVSSADERIGHLYKIT